MAALTFLIFGAVALGPVLGDLTWAIVAYAVLSLTLVRMVPVAVALVGSRPRPVTVGFVGWFGPRGLASIVFALDLVGESGLEEAPLIVRVVGLTVALSVLLHGLSAAPAARRYGEWYSHHEQREDLAESGPAIEVRPAGPACSAVGRSRSEPRSALVVVDRCGLAGDGSQEGDHAPAQGWGGEGGGDRPGAFVGMRTRSAPGIDRKCRGGSRRRASPSTPASMGSSLSTTNSGVAHSRTPRNRWIRPAASAATSWAASAALCTSAVITPSRPVSSRARVPKPPSRVEDVGVVRHLDDLGAGVLGPVGAGEAQVEGIGVGAEEVGQELGRGLPLRIAVLLRLDDLGVHAQRDVVDEDPVTDGGEVDATLDGIGEGVQRPDHVVAVEAEVEGEVVAGAGRDADERHVGLHGDRRHEGLGPVASRHADHIGPSVDGVLGQLEQVVAGTQHDRLDAAAPGLVLEVEAARPSRPRTSGS